MEAWSRGDDPKVPPRALQYTPWIARHADSDEDAIRTQAEFLSMMSESHLKKYLGRYAEKFFDDKNPTPRTQKNIRRTLRSLYKQYNEQAAQVLGIVGKNGEKYVSNITKEHRRIQLRKQEKWIQATHAIKKEAEIYNNNNKKKKKIIPLADCIRTPEARFAELYTLVKGQEEYFTEHGYAAIFVTLTAPARFHPNPIKGKNSWDGSSVVDSHNEFFNPKWQKFRYAIKNLDIKIEGFRVTEPHQDGAEHWHVLIYVKKSHIETIKNEIRKQFSHSPNSVKFITDFQKDK